MGNEYIMMVFSTISTLVGGITTAVAFGERNALCVSLLVKMTLLALLLLLSGCFAIPFSLGRPDLLISMVANRSSSFYWVAIFAGLTFLGLLGFVWAHYRYFEKRLTFGFSLLAMGSSLLLLFATSEMLVMPWRAAWNTHTISFLIFSWGALCVKVLGLQTKSSLWLGAQSNVLSALPIICVACYLIRLALSGEWTWQSADMMFYSLLGLLLCEALLPFFTEKWLSLKA